MKKTVIICILAGLVCDGIWAEDYNPPPWDRQDPGATSQIWEFSTEYPPDVSYPPIPADQYNNNAGEPTVSLTSGFPENTLWQAEYPQGSGHYGIWGFEDDMIASIPNFEDLNPLKEVWVQMTYLADFAPNLWLLPEGDIPSGALMDLLDETPVGDGYTLATWYGSIEPNPLYEEIWIRSCECTVYIDELVIDTICHVNGTPTVLLLAPNGGEVLIAGTTYDVTWTSTGSIVNVLMENSTNNGADWVTIDTVPNTGSYNWLVPAVDSNQCLVRISEASNPDVNDISDGVFTIEMITIYVDNDAPDDPGPNNPDVNDPNEDGSPEHPFDAIQEGIDTATDGDTVIVLTGTYTGNGNREIDFLGKAITVRSTDPNDPCVVAATVVDCQGAIGQWYYGFAFWSGEGANTFLDGLTITGAIDLNIGGGINCGGSSPTIRNCIIRGNYGMGGGINCGGSSPTISNCIIASNQGGAIRCLEASPIIINCTIIGNDSLSWGGAIYCRESSPTIINCLIAGNRAGPCGGGIHCRDSSATIRDCTIATNYAADGNAISCDSHQQGSPSTLQLTNCIIWNGSDGFWNNDGSTITITYSDVQGGWPDGEGNIDADPCFVAAGYWNPNGTPSDANDDFWVDGDYHLRPESPCIDAGDNNSVPADSNDIDGDGNTVEPIPWDLDSRNRFADGDCNDSNVVDMGAYEFAWAYIGDFDGQCDVDFADWAIFALAWLTEEGESQYNALCDIGLPADNYIDWRDVEILCDNWLAGL